jgi:uncharacterized protein with GYD domain
MVEEFGGRLVDAFWTIGAHDLVAIVEVPDADALTAVLLRVGALGNVRTTMLQAFRRDEMASIVAKAAGTG